MNSPILRPGDTFVGTSPVATIYVAFGRAAFHRVVETLTKASPDDPVHPGWPAGTPGGLGGKFRPKDGGGSAGAQAAVERIALRREIRAFLTQILRLPMEIVANTVPVLGEAVDIALVAELAETIAEYRRLQIDLQAATNFIANGPYSLEALRVAEDSESFLSYNQFYKGGSFDECLLKRFGRAGDGYQYHHIIEQNGTNSINFVPEELQNTDNIIRIPTLLHEAINSEIYSRLPSSPGMSYRTWLQLQPYAVQRAEGIAILLELGIIRQ